jgi:hypothetical protein
MEKKIVDNGVNIRKMGAVFTNNSELSQGEYSLKFMARCKVVSEKDHDDRAIYANGEVKTVMAASQLAKPYNLEEGSNFPEKIEFNVDEKNRIIF